MLAAVYSIAELCRTLEVSTSGYYAWKKGGRGSRARENRELGEKIKEIHKQNRGVYGSPLITRDLHDSGIRCGHNRVARIMKVLGIQGVQKSRFKPKTTDSKHNLAVSPNLLDQIDEVSRPNQAYVSDITYIPTRKGWVYLCAFMDMCTRAIKGWALRDYMDAGLVIDAFSAAAFKYTLPPGLIIHSDRGSQYASKDFHKTLKAHKALGSMGRTGCCYDNAAMESFWSTLKAEMNIRESFASLEDARIAIFDYIDTFYNPRRRHSLIGYLAPLDFESHLADRFIDPKVSACSG